MRRTIFLLMLTLSVSLTSCSTAIDYLPGVYSLDIQQGNIINQDMIDQLRPKMTKRQIIYIMGSPMLVDVFHQKRWDYLYSEQPGGESRQQKRLSLFFNGDELIGVQGDFRPSKLPVIRKSKETTVEIPKRDLDNTLWGKFSRLFEDDEAIKKPEKTTQEDIISTDTAIEPATISEVTETTPETPKTIENEVISTTPLEEDKPQELEEIENQQVKDSTILE